MARIVIDPGHGGTRAVGKSTPFGARGAGGTVEKDVTLALAREVAEELRGEEVRLTRTADENLPLAARAEVARMVDADVFLSLHANAGAAGQRGAEIWSHGGANGGSRSLAARLGRVLGGTARAAELAVLDPARLPTHTAACLVEVDYLTHPEAEARLADPHERRALAASIAKAVRSHARFRGDQEPIELAPIHIAPEAPVELPPVVITVPWIPDHFKVIGIDVSANNGIIDWTRVAAWRHPDGHRVSFVFVKATEGTGGCDGQLATNWSALAAHPDILRGPYHFYTLGLGGRDQARHFHATVVAAGGYRDADLPPVIDYEPDPSSQTSAAIDELWNCLVETQQLFGRTPIIYTGSYVWNDPHGPRDDARFRALPFPLWIAQYDNPAVPFREDGFPKSIDPRAPAKYRKHFVWNNPTVPMPKFTTRWDFWQFRVAPGRATWKEIDGIGTDVDLDVWNGDWSGLKALTLAP